MRFLTCQALYLRGQAKRLQALDSMAGPSPFVAQSRPPLDGEGLSQLLYLCVSPPPHVTSQSDHSLHFEYAPSSVNHEKYDTFNENSARQKRTTTTCSRTCLNKFSKISYNYPNHKLLHNLLGVTVRKVHSVRNCTIKLNLVYSRQRNNKPQVRKLHVVYCFRQAISCKMVRLFFTSKGVELGVVIEAQSVTI